MPRYSRTRRKTRDQLLEATAEVLYRKGLRGTRVDDLERAAGLARPTLYEYYKSKKSLVVAALAARVERRKSALETIVDQSGGGLGGLMALVENYQRLRSSDGFRGCPLVAAATEESDEAVREIASDFKLWTERLLAESARQAGLRQPEQLAESLMLVLEGANVLAPLQRRPGWSRAVTRAIRQLLEVHGAGGRQRKRRR